MRNHHDIVLGKCKIELDSIASNLNCTLKCGHRVLGVLALEATMADNLWDWVWCLCGICPQLGPANTSAFGQILLEIHTLYPGRGLLR